jgi:diguanylate cyclase (GGDEF)-like protein
MLKFLYSWRFYTFGREKYQECINDLFSNNLLGLRQANTIFAVFVGIFSLFPIIYQRNFITAGIYLLSALVAMILAMYSNYKMQISSENNKFIYILIVIFYANVMLFGTYLSVWSNTGELASIFLCFLIVALLMFVNPPIFNLILTLCAMAVFIVSAILMKKPQHWTFDIINCVIAGIMGLYFNWHNTKLRLGLELSANMLEEEKNKYFDQSTIDELTKCKNRRDFQATFQRYQSNYRTFDEWLCIALSDIDFFKFYNDHYGHPMGDECLRSVGRVLNSLMESHGVYAARVGGEEFAMLWFEKDAAHASEVVSHISNSINKLKIPHEKSKVMPHVTLSIGVYIEKCGSPTDTSVLYDLADKALYTAKSSGRNCAIISGSEIKEYKITPNES